MVHMGPSPFTMPTRFELGGVSWFQPATPYRGVVSQPLPLALSRPFPESLVPDNTLEPGAYTRPLLSST